MQSSFGKIQKAAQQQSAAGDLSLLFNFMKTLDPGSVVRESEFAAAARAGSLPERVQGAALQVIRGQRLTKAQRSDFLQTAENNLLNQIQLQESVNEQFRGIADDNRFEASNTQLGIRAEDTVEGVKKRFGLGAQPTVAETATRPTAVGEGLQAQSQQISQVIAQQKQAGASDQQIQGQLEQALGRPLSTQEQQQFFGAKTVQQQQVPQGELPPQFP